MPSVATAYAPQRPHSETIRGYRDVDTGGDQLDEHVRVDCAAVRGKSKIMVKNR